MATLLIVDGFQEASIDPATPVSKVAGLPTKRER